MHVSVARVYGYVYESTLYVYSICVRVMCGESGASAENSFKNRSIEPVGLVP